MPDTQTRAEFVMRWIWATVVGWGLALLSIAPAFGIWDVTATLMWQHFRDTEWYLLWTGWIGDAVFLLLILGTLILMGLSMGLGQWWIALKNKVDRRIWITSSALTIAAGFIGLLTIGRVAPSPFDHHIGQYSGIDNSYTVNNAWPITVIILSVAHGLPLGIVQWIVLRRHFYNASYWLLAVPIASFVMFTALVGVVFVIKSDFLSWGLGCCVSPVVFGAVTGVALYSLLRHPKHTVT